MRLLTLLILPFTVFAVFLFNLFKELNASFPKAEVKVPFSHREHIRSYGAKDCEICHSYTDEGKFTGLPKIGQCRSCHGAKQNTEKDENETAASNSYDIAADIFAEYDDEDCPWETAGKQKALPSFSHITVLSARFDDGRKKVTCVSCHGGKEDSEDNAKIRESLSMGQCLSCHKALRLDTSCMVCH